MRTLLQKIKKSWIPVLKSIAICTSRYSRLNKSGTFAGMTRGVRGFTLIETLFAILIFSAALVALMSIAGRGISATSSARQQITAHYLAQEGLEVVRNMRDANYVNRQLWTRGFVPDCEGETSSCNVVYNPMPDFPPALDPNASPILETNSEGFFVDAGDGTPTLFSRFIWVESRHPLADGSGPSEYEVVSQVKWESKGVPRVVELRTLLKKWQ